MKMPHFQDMKPFIQNPLFGALLSFMAGITGFIFIGKPLFWLGFPFCVMILWLWKGSAHYFQKNPIRLSALSLLFILLGGFHGWLHQPDPISHSLADLEESDGIFTGVVSKAPKATPYGRYTWLDLESFQNEETGVALREKVVVYLQPKDSLPFSKGDTLIILGSAKRTTSKNQGYLDFLASVGIRHSIKAKQVLLYAHQHSGLSALIEPYRQQLSNGLKSAFGQVETGAIASAMFLGDKTSLSREIKASFATSGLSHILAVSGLHVGVIYLGLGMLLFPLMRIPHGAKIRQILILIGLLGYMLLAGAGPAVVRAVLMFGLLILVKLFGKKSHLLTALSFSAWIQILIDPMIICQIGFQLSYSAVLGIFWILPVIERHFSPGSPVWLRHLNSGMAVTIAASLMTAPLVWIYFGAFPTWFLVSNILVSFLAFPMILTGFSIVILIALFPDWGLISIIIDGCEIMLNLLLFWSRLITELPYARMETGSILPIHGWIISSQIILAFSFFTWKQIQRQGSILIRSATIQVRSSLLSRSAH